MKIADLAPVLVTRMEVLNNDGQPTGVFFTGHTPVSKEFEAANRKYFPPAKSQSLYVGKNGDNRLEIANDPKGAEKRTKVLAEITTNVEGIDEYDAGGMTVLELFEHPLMVEAVAQWREHLDDKGKHLPPSEPSVKRTSKSSAG